MYGIDPLAEPSDPGTLSDPGSIFKDMGSKMPISIHIYMGKILKKKALIFLKKVTDVSSAFSQKHFAQHKNF